jgi:hypothetical protein
LSKHFNDKFQVPRIVRPIRLAEYAPEMGEAMIEVWVNPPRKIMAEFFDIAKQVGEVNKELFELAKRAPVKDEPTNGIQPALDPSPAGIGNDRDAGRTNPPGASQPDSGTLSKEELAEKEKLLLEQINQLTEQTYAWYSVIWSQGKDGSNHFSAADVKKLVESLKEQDPSLWPWLAKGTQRLINEHRERAKKG